MEIENREKTANLGNGCELANKNLKAQLHQVVESAVNATFA
jgi:hypothetical protein